MAADDQEQVKKFSADIALHRLILAIGIGCAFILIHGVHFGFGIGTNFFNFVSVAILTAGAATVSGGLLGFLFGVPHTREGYASQINSKSTDTSNGQEDRADGPSSNYRPNTSLEQISDWLTKMLVGIGLVEIKVIPGNLRDLAAYVTKGFGSAEQGDTLALAIMIYFSICGFLIGFLWARLYLPRLFHEADELRALRQEVSRLETQALADVRARTLINRLLNPRPDDPPATQMEVTRAIKASSPDARTEILSQARATSGNKKSDDYQAKLQGVILILKALIDSDKNEHRYYSELSYAWLRMDPPNPEAAEESISMAIKVRDMLNKKGWKYYEFHRARCHIARDPNFTGNKKKPAEQFLLDETLADLRVAYTEQERWNEWLENNRNVREWLALNNIHEDVLGTQPTNSA